MPLCHSTPYYYNYCIHYQVREGELSSELADALDALDAATRDRLGADAARAAAEERADFAEEQVCKKHDYATIVRHYDANMLLPTQIRLPRRRRRARGRRRVSG